MAWRTRRARRVGEAGSGMRGVYRRRAPDFGRTGPTLAGTPRMGRSDVKRQGDFFRRGSSLPRTRRRLTVANR